MGTWTRGSAGPPNLDINPHQHPGPQEEARSRRRRDRAVTSSRLLQSCSQALQRDSAQPHGSQPHRRGLFPQPAGRTRSPPSPCPLTAPVTAEPPPWSHSSLCPHPGTTSSSPSPSTGRDPSSRGSERWRAGWGGQSASAHHLCSALGSARIWPFPSKAPYGIKGAEHQLLLWHLSRHWEKDLGCFFPGRWD